MPACSRRGVTAWPIASGPCCAAGRAWRRPLPRRAGIAELHGHVSEQAGVASPCSITCAGNGALCTSPAGPAGVSCAGTAAPSCARVRHRASGNILADHVARHRSTGACCSGARSVRSLARQIVGNVAHRPACRRKGSWRSAARRWPAFRKRPELRETFRRTPTARVSTPVGIGSPPAFEMEYRG